MSAKSEMPGWFSPARWNGQLSITVTLATAISLLVLVSVGSVLGVGMWIASKNTLALMSANANQSTASMIDRIERHLLPAEDQARFIAERIESGEFNPENRTTFGRLLTGSLAGVPQIESISFLDPRLKSLYVARYEGSRIEIGEIDHSDDPRYHEYLASIPEEPHWVPPYWIKRHEGTYFSRVHPVWRGDRLVGATAATASIRELSAFVRKISEGGPGTQFILYGHDHVLAHPLMANGYPDISIENPLPRLAGFLDPVLAAMWQQEGRFDLVTPLAQGTNGHRVRVGEQEYVFVFRRLHGFGPKHLIVGIWYHVEDVSTELSRMIVALLVSVGALVLSIIAALILGRRIARPIVRFSAATGQVRDLNINEIGDLPGSVFRELDQQAKSFNAMLRALRWFELYIPWKVVERLVKHGEIEDAASAEREVTVMFTDITGFSSVAENLSAPDVAALVNRHFEIVAGCIEAEDGTVDKFIGDSVMAFWGAPEAQPDAAERACRAALSIADGVRTENVRRRAAGEVPLDIRIGIHSGNATVGNIGAPGRINYTIIGDTVNIGQRLEQLVRTLYPAGNEATILVSGTTASELGPDFCPTPVGRYPLKGRSGEVDVFKLGG
ncbi:MAG: adenylate/guanylate cyclase domain-containing protein [Gammaproteobacteria bacterium]|nr:adenylate/guanylate cyclase domain-containing protein [Gammaproteobacteria bacterium]